MSEGVEVRECACGCGEVFSPRKARSRFLVGHNSRRTVRTGRPDWIVDVRGCWIWQGRLTDEGYPRGWDRQRKTMRGAHQIMYEQERGPVPDGCELDHLCRETRCVNPAHLDAVPHKVNYLRSSRIRLTPDQITEIRRRYAQGGIRQADLGAEYGIGQSHVSQIVRGTIW